jgi:hypothetical protein
MVELVDYARQVAPAIGRLGGAWMVSNNAKDAARQLGVKGWPAYIKGRGSVLGDVDADVVDACFGFFDSSLIEAGWSAPCEKSIDEIEGVYAHACREWSRERFSDLPGLARLTELLGAVSDGARVSGLPLFAGWRAVPRATDLPGMLGQRLHELREYRGGSHLVAVLASGLTPLEAIAAGPGGSGNATFFGWEESEIPSPEVIAAIGPQRARAEDLTDEMVAPSWAALGYEDRSELAGLLGAALDHAEART